MNIYELRASIMVTVYGSFWNYKNIGLVGYSINAMPQPQITFTASELKNELISIGSIDEDTPDEAFMNYRLSQWDALNIAIRYEQAKEADKDINASDIAKAIDKLLNNQ